MVTSTADTVYIVKEDGVLGGAPHISGRRIGVHDVANLYIRLEGTVDDLVEMYELTPAQIHAALAYYYDHREEVDAIIDENNRLASEHSDDDRSRALKAEARQMVEARMADPNAEITVAELAEAYSLSTPTIRIAIKNGWIPARKSGATWLIRRSDAEARWGKRASKAG